MMFHLYLCPEMHILNDRRHEVSRYVKHLINIRISTCVGFLLIFGLVLDVSASLRSITRVHCITFIAAFLGGSDGGVHKTGEMTITLHYWGISCTH